MLQSLEIELSNIQKSFVTQILHSRTNFLILSAEDDTITRVGI